MMTPAEARRALDVETTAAWDDVRQSYRDLVRVWHPDRFESDPRLRAKAERRTADINAAFRILERYRHLPLTPLPAVVVRGVAVVTPRTRARTSGTGRKHLVLAMVSVSALIVAPWFTQPRDRPGTRAVPVSGSPGGTVSVRQTSLVRSPVARDTPRPLRTPAVVHATPRSFIDRETDALLTGSDRTSR